MLIEWQCTQLCYRFAHYLDTGNFAAMIALFTPDGIFDRVGQILRGREQMHAAFRERSPGVTSRHVVSNVHFLEVQADRAEARVYNMSYHADGGDKSQPLVYATSNGRCIDFHDVYTLTDQGWRFISRAAKVIFVPQDWPA
jgi:3-phenylpropionate/cinnamic acid dioxygenase small subunit